MEVTVGVGDLVYLDAAASTPIAPEALTAMLAVLQGHPGNPSAVHAAGRAAADTIAEARERIGELLNAGPAAVLLLGSATEANNLALRGLHVAPSRAGVTVSTTEHDSVLETARTLGATGRDVRVAPVAPSGEIDLDELERVVDSTTALVSIQAANNETGVVQRIGDVAEIVHRTGALLHVDASQLLAWGRHEMLDAADLVTVSAHKMHGPQGAAALVVRSSARGLLRPQVTGGGQERGLRSGTPNVAAIAGFGAAALLARTSGHDAARRVRELRLALQSCLMANMHGVVEHGATASDRLPGILNVAVGVDDPEAPEADVLLARTPEIAASTGSACHVGVPEPSAVLRAMGVSDWEAARSIRFSLSRYTDQSDVVRAAELLGATQRHLDNLLHGITEGSANR